MEDIGVGDVVLFYVLSTGGFICHRVTNIKLNDNEFLFQTKGDANEYPDPDLVSPQNFVGKTIFYLPHAGKVAYLTRFHETPITLMGRQISIALLIILAIAVTLVGTELKNMWEWIFRAEFKRHQ